MPRFLVELGNLRRAEGDWLLHEDVSSMSDRGLGQREVVERRGADVNYVDGSRLQQGFEGTVQVCYSILVA